LKIKRQVDVREKREAVVGVNIVFISCSGERRINPSRANPKPVTGQVGRPFKRATIFAIIDGEPS